MTNKYFCSYCDKSLTFDDLAYRNFFIGKYYYHSINEDVVCKKCFNLNKKKTSNINECNNKISNKQNSK